MRLEALQGDDVNREARRIADVVAAAIEPELRRLIEKYRDPIAAAAMAVHGLLTAAGDGIGTQAAVCRIAWSTEDRMELHGELQAAIHKATMKIHARVNGKMN